jgi:hypothetical protein
MAGREAQVPEGHEHVCVGPRYVKARSPSGGTARNRPCGPVGADRVCCHSAAVAGGRIMLSYTGLKRQPGVRGSFAPRYSTASSPMSRRELGAAGPGRAPPDHSSHDATAEQRPVRARPGAVRVPALPPARSELEPGSGTRPRGGPGKSGIGPDWGTRPPGDQEQQARCQRCSLAVPAATRRPLAPPWRPCTRRVCAWGPSLTAHRPEQRGPPRAYAAARRGRDAGLCNGPRSAS